MSPVPPSLPLDWNRGADADPTVQALLTALKAHRPALLDLLTRVDDHWGAEDGVYRFYHSSWKVVFLRDRTVEIVAALRAVAPDRELNTTFLKIVQEGTEKRPHEDKRPWQEASRPMVEAFFHARYFLAMAVKYAEELPIAPMRMPSGWAALLCLYGLR